MKINNPKIFSAILEPIDIAEIFNELGKGYLTDLVYNTATEEEREALGLKAKIIDYKITKVEIELIYEREEVENEK